MGVAEVVKKSMGTRVRDATPIAIIIAPVIIGVLGWFVEREISHVDQSLAYLQSGVNAALSNQVAQTEINKALADHQKVADDSAAQQYRWFQTQFQNVNNALLQLARDGR